MPDVTSQVTGGSNPDVQAMHIVIVGLGLIGASFAAALRQAGFAGRITGVVRSSATGEQALQQRLVDAVHHDIGAAVSDADVVLLAVPMLAMEAQLQGMVATLPDAAIVTDAGSVKGYFAQQALRYLSNPSRLVPGHPIAGAERSGIAAANPDLYQQRRIILTPLPETAPAAVAAVSALWQFTGAVVEQLEVDHHDRVLAATSHVPHVLAYALVDALAKQQEAEEIFRYAAGGFRDFTRIASSDPVMWRDICLTNPDAILSSLDTFSRHLQYIRSAIETGDGDTLEDTFNRARNTRENYTDVQT